jgi:undecaprenyl phosphate-alpha-L-ara4N flippase subunit ArnE
MSLSQFAFIVLTVLALSAGQILFKLASSGFELSGAGLISNVLNIRLVLALLVYAFATIMWLLVLKSTPLRVAYPFTALAFFIVPVLAHFLLGEKVGWNTFAGAGLIAGGVWISVFR